MRKKATVLNAITGIVYQFIMLILNFSCRKIFITSLGIDYLGLNGLFSNILAMLSLAELGVGTAIVYNLYKPVAENNEYEICGLMNLYKLVYRMIAALVGVIGIAVMFFLPYIIHESSQDMSYIRIIYLLFLTNTVLSYFMGYKRSLLYVAQKNYILICADMIINVVGTVVKIILLVVTKNYILYLLALIAFTFIPNLIGSIIADKTYPCIKSNHIKLAHEKFKKIVNDMKNIFIHKVSCFVVNSTDNMIISTFIGIRAVGLLSNYSLIINTVIGFINQGINATQASLGNLIVSESREKVEAIYKKLSYLYFVISSFCAVSFWVLLHPFISLWIGTENLLLDSTVELTIINMYLTILSKPIWQLMSISGLFKEDKFNALIEMSLNLILSIILVKIIGLPGVVLGTTISYLVAWVLKTQLLYKQYFNSSPFRYYLSILGYMLLTIFEVFLTRQIGSYLQFKNSILDFLVNALLCVSIPNSLNIILFCRTESFKYYVNALKQGTNYLRTKKRHLA